jgi:hypothetical protein
MSNEFNFNFSESKNSTLLRKKSSRTNRLAAKYSHELDLEKIKDNFLEEIIYKKINSRYLYI